MAVRAHKVEVTEFVNRLQATGTVRADEEVTLRPEVAGRVIEIHFREGQKVDQGELLLKINDAELRAQLRRLEYRKNLASIKEQRTRNLVERNAIAQEEYDIAFNELNVVMAEIDLIKAQIEQTEIRAPFDGVIGLKYVSKGAYVTPNSEIASFQNIDKIKIDFSVPERHSSIVREGQRFTFRTQADRNPVTGQILAIEPRIQTDTRTLQLRGIADNPGGRIFPGAFVEIAFELEAIDNAIMVPTESIIPVMGGQNVLVYRDGVAEIKPVSLGVRTEARVQVTDGLAPGDTLITTGILQLRPGMPVRIAEFR